MVTSVAGKARGSADGARCIEIAASLDGRLPVDVGLRALTRAERVLVDAARRHRAGLDPEPDTAGPQPPAARAEPDVAHVTDEKPGAAGIAGEKPRVAQLTGAKPGVAEVTGAAPSDDALDAAPRDVLLLTVTGRLRAVPAGWPVPAGAHRLGALVWPAGRPSGLSRACRDADGDRAGYRQIHAWLAAQPDEAVRDRIEGIAYSLVHMAPVLLYVGDRCYTNLGRYGSLPGNSIRYGTPRCQLTALAGTPVAQWSAEDACFVACLSALLRSGPPVRAEEFNGVQLDQYTLEEFLCERLRTYRATVPAREPGEPTVPWLERLAAACAAARAARQRDGATFYREINGLSLHKREHLMQPPVTVADVPDPVLDLLAERTGHPLSRDSDVKDVTAALGDLAPRVVGAPAPAGFSSAYEAFLHELFVATAESTGSDVAMGRGPRALDQLREGSGDGSHPLRLGTGDFYCCVVASAAFTARFAADRSALARALSAYSARMRFNTWHYLPHTLDLHAHRPGRDDWFFAPTMPDLTVWSDQHHTGHVQFGVRYAIRVPIGIVFDGAYRPGLYDLRLLRTGGQPYPLGHLRAGIAVGQVLAVLHETMTGYDFRIDDFGNEWYRTFHATSAGPR
jgi:hypothetical protein